MNFLGVRGLQLWKSMKKCEKCEKCEINLLDYYMASFKV